MCSSDHFESGRLVVLDHGDLATAIRASMSVPGAFAPVEMDGQVLVDGGLAAHARALLDHLGAARSPVKTLINTHWHWNHTGANELLGKAGVPYSTYAHMGNGIWSSGRVRSPRGYSARDGNAKSPEWKGTWAGKTYTEPLSHGRVYSEQEIWDNYTYFIRKVKPVAEEAGVRIGIHPDDPPQRMLAGVPRCIFSNFEGYKKAIEIADSPNIGVCFCVGSWLEGGKSTGADPVDAIKYFAGKKKLFKKIGRAHV